MTEGINGNSIPGFAAGIQGAPTKLDSLLKPANKGAIPFNFDAGDAGDKPIKGFELERTTENKPAEEVQEQPQAKEAESKEYIVRKGDSLWNIAKRAIMEENGGKKPTNKEILERMYKIMEDNGLKMEKDGKHVKINVGDKLIIGGEAQGAEKPEKPAAEKEKPETPKAEDKPKPKPETPKKEEPGKLIHAEAPKKEEPKNLGVAQQPAPKKRAELTPAEMNRARGLGDDVSDYLVGYTMDSEQGHVKRIITQDINSRNVADFLSGYEEHKGMGDHFFEQMRTEYGFKDNQNLMRNVAKKLSANLKAHGQTGWAREVDVVLQNQQFTAEHTKVLDEIVRLYLVSLPELKR